MNISLAKNHIRQLAKKRIEEFFDNNNRIDADNRIVNRLTSAQLYKNAKTIFSFYPMHHEPMITEIFKDKKKDFYYPKISGEKLLVGTGKLSPGKFGLYEPVIVTNVYEFDLILVPAMAYDIHFNRLGRGLGYFDRFLKTAKGFKLGICYDVQVFASIPVEEHDEKVDGILTEKRFLTNK
ncbi:MAG: 5-formyltetrahydrofolate cyclo-ligase [Candidatus Micrarchaeota archaeon]|nr:5-formyltetrahydrofolate cyclo-ligase [Candidatus Micrarchaeota archaeon]